MRFIKGLILLFIAIILVWIVCSFAVKIFAILIPPFNFVAFIVAFCVGVPVAFHYFYEIYCASIGVQPSCTEKPSLATASVDVKAREHGDEMDARMARIEEMLAELKQQNDALSEDYRFLTRVLDKDEE